MISTGRRTRRWIAAMRRLPRWAAVGAAGAVWLWTGAPASAATPAPSVHLVLAFSTVDPGAETGVHLALTVSGPGGRPGKPPALTGAVLTLPQGTVIDTSVRPRCTASDLELATEGSLACPPSSAVGAGEVVGYTGLGRPVDPLVGDDHVFNGDHQLIEVVTAPGTPLSPAHDRLTITGDTATAHPPLLPGGPPDGHTTIGHLEFTIPPTASPAAFPTGARPYVRTPAVCPRTAEWVTLGRFTFSGGTRVDATAVTPCADRSGG